MLDVPYYGRGVVRQRRFGIGIGRTNRIEVVVDDHVVIPVADVTSILAGQRPFIDWGVHGGRGTWLVKGSMQQRRTVSLADDRAFIHALSTGDT